MNRGSENHYVELTDDGSIGFNITPPCHIGFIGKNGDINDHYVDQVNMYEEWEYKPIHIERTKILENMKEKEQVFIPNN